MGEPGVEFFYYLQVQIHTMSGHFAGRVLVYSIVGCPHCKTAKHTLTEKGIPYTEVSLDKYDPSVAKDVKLKTGKTTVPQIFFNERFIGGNVELQELVSYLE